MIGESTFTRRRWDTGAAVTTLIAVGALVRFVLAASTGLGVDESYAVAVARPFSLSYFDHPPILFWLAGVTAQLAHSEAAPVVRFPFVLCFAGTTWFVFSIAQRLFGARAGLLAALLLNVSAVFSLSTGTWVLPDGPLMLFTTAAVDRISAILFDEAPGAATLGAWALAGLLTGMALLSKYHGVFVLAGTAGALATTPRLRAHLATPGPYVGTAIALACFAPVLVWNAQHHWASFVFQGGRAAPASGIHLDTFVANIGGQMAWVLPWIFVPLAAAAWRALRAGPRDERRWFLLALAAGPVVGFTLVSLKGDVGLPHWQAPGWLFVFPLLGAAVDERLAAGSAATRRWLRWSVGGYVALVAVVGSHAATGWLARVAPSAFERGDPTADLVTWRQLRQVLVGLGQFPSDRFVAAPSWIQAGKASVALGPDIPVVCLCADPHHFLYLRPDSALYGHDAVIVRKARSDDDILTRMAPYFERIDPVTRFGVYRHGQEVMMLEVYRALNYRAPYPTAQPR